MRSSWVWGAVAILAAIHGTKSEDDYGFDKCFEGSFPTDVSEDNKAKVEENLLGKTIIFENYVLDCDGEVNSFSFFAQQRGEFYFVIFQPQKDLNKIKLVGFNKIQVTRTGPQTLLIPEIDDNLTDEEKVGREKVEVDNTNIVGLYFPEKMVMPVVSFRERPGVALVSKVHIMNGVPYGDIKLKDQNIEFDYPQSVESRYFAVPMMAFVKGSTTNLRMVGPIYNAGIAEMFKDGIWGRICDRWPHSLGWPNLFCKNIGFPGSIDYRFVTPEERDDEAVHYMRNLKCKASALQVFYNCELIDYDKCLPGQQVHVTCDPRIRLEGGDHRCQGVAQIFRFGRWNTICDELHDPEWHMNNADYNSWTDAFCREIQCSDQGPLEVNYAVDAVNNYSPTTNTRYSNPQCFIYHPTTMEECVKLSGQVCGIEHDYYIDCGPPPEKSGKAK